MAREADGAAEGWIEGDEGVSRHKTQDTALASCPEPPDPGGTIQRWWNEQAQDTASASCPVPPGPGKEGCGYIWHMAHGTWEMDQIDEII